MSDKDYGYDDGQGIRPMWIFSILALAALSYLGIAVYGKPIISDDERDYSRDYSAKYDIQAAGFKNK